MRKRLITCLIVGAVLGAACGALIVVSAAAPPSPVAKAMSRMEAAARADGTSPALLSTLKANAVSFEGTASKEGVSAEQQINTFNDVTHLFDARSGLIDKSQRILVAEEIISQAAEPEIISQGSHNTCSVTALEERTFVLDPGVAANLIVSVALTGKWTAPDGEAMTASAKSIWPGPEESKYPVPPLDRSRASEIFQVTVLDLLGLLPNPPAYGQEYQPLNPPLYFEQLKPDLSVGDTGEYWANKTGKVVGIFLGLNDENIAVAAHILFPGFSNFVISNKDLGDAPSVVSVGSAAQLASTLARLQALHALPALVVVRGYAAIFGLGVNDPNESVDHVIDINSYDAANGTAYVVNPWGHKYDRWVSVKALYNATIND